MATTMQGVYITVLGMAVLFAALLILMLAAMGLERLFRSKEIAEEVPVELEKDKELVAAIAVALALNRKAQTSSVKREKSEQAASAWKIWGRHRQLMSSREIRGRCQ